MHLPNYDRNQISINLAQRQYITRSLSNTQVSRVRNEPLDYYRLAISSIIGFTRYFSCQRNGDLATGPAGYRISRRIATARSTI